MLIKGKLRKKKRNIKKILGIQVIQASFRQRGKKKGREGRKVKRKTWRIEGRKERKEGGREGLATQLQN